MELRRGAEKGFEMSDTRAGIEGLASDEVMPSQLRRDDKPPGRALGRLNPATLGYLMGPASFVAILFLRRVGAVAKEPVWLYLSVFVAIPAASGLADLAYRHDPSRRHLHFRVAVHIAAVTTVIYLTGWGPVVMGAYAFVALENIARSGSQTWRVTAGWSLLGITAGQLAIAWSWAPSFLTGPQAQVLGLLGAFVLMFEIRMAGAASAQKEEAESRLAHQALHDSLTGLANRVLLIDRLNEAVLRSLRPETPPPVVMFLDLDRFKLVNDSLGHSTGDELLIQVASRLRAVMRKTDTLARFGGDEFVMLCEGIADRETAMAIAERTMQALDAPFELSGEQIVVGMSIGVAFVDDDVPSAEALLGDADFAMYLAKTSHGGGRIEFFDRATRAFARSRVHTETALARALERDELVVFYQPIVDVRTRGWVGVEALLRWQHPTRGLLLPAAFLDVAEHTGLIVPIGAWVLSVSCQQVKRWNEDRPAGSELGLSVNLSGRQLAEPDLASNLRTILHEAGIEPRSLKLLLEVTETLLPANQQEARRNLTELHDLGIQLGIDDFGTGYSTLEYIRELPVNIIKIDRSLIDGLGRSPQDEAIVSAVTQLAHTLKMKVVAEGVETEAQLSYLVGVACDFAQGYLFAHPQPAELLEPALAAVDATSL
jgi:diguanylate cyclase (GGDEF)-like protein